MFNPIFMETGVEASRTCASAETKLLSHRKPKRVVQNEKIGHRNANVVTIIVLKTIEVELYQENS